MSEAKKKFIVSAEFLGQRLDQVLATVYPELSRSRWVQLIKSENVRVNSKKAKGSQSLNLEDLVEIFVNAQDSSEDFKEKVESGDFEYLGLEPKVVYQDDDLLVLSKPEGLVVHPGKGVSLESTLVGWLLKAELLKNAANEIWSDELIEHQRIGIVHRLDKDTSGLMLVARNYSTHRKLTEAFSEKKIQRFYWAIVPSRIERISSRRPKFLEDLLLEKWAALKIDSLGVHSLITQHGRHSNNPLKFSSLKRLAKKAVSHWKITSRCQSHSLLDFRLETGRTHQIRVHLSTIGCPIVGDSLYGGEDHFRMGLHARQISFFHPKSGKLMSFSDESCSFSKLYGSIGLKGEKFWEAKDMNSI